MFKLAALSLLILASVCSAAICPLNNNASPTPTNTLTICPQWNGVPSCCNASVEQQFSTLTTLQGLLGGGNCATDLVGLFCNILCEPTQQYYVRPVSNIPTIFVSDNTSNLIYDACAPVCVYSTYLLNPNNDTSDTRGEILLDTLSQFLLQLGVGIAGSNESTAANLTDVLPANAADRATCDTVTTSTTGGVSTGTTTNNTTGSSSTTGDSGSSTSTTTGGASSTSTTSSASSVVIALFSVVLIVATIVL